MSTLRGLWSINIGIIRLDLGYVKKLKSVYVVYNIKHVLVTTPEINEVKCCYLRKSSSPTVVTECNNFLLACRNSQLPELQLTTGFFTTREFPGKSMKCKCNKISFKWLHTHTARRNQCTHDVLPGIEGTCLGKKMPISKYLSQLSNL